MTDLDRLEKLGLNTAEGLACCADDPDFYEDMLKEYLSEAPARINALKNALASSDAASYGISAHSLKSTSKMIGAIALSEKARELEAAAKANDVKTVSEAHNAFISDLEALVTALSDLLSRG